MPSGAVNHWGAPQFEEAFFAEDEVYTVGQPIAVMAATSAAQASKATRAAKIEYEEFPAVFTVEEAVGKESFFDFFREIKKDDDVDTAFECHDHIFTRVSRMNGQEHLYLETQASSVAPRPEDSELEIFSSTQNANET